MHAALRFPPVLLLYTWVGRRLHLSMSGIERQEAIAWTQPDVPQLYGFPRHNIKPGSFAFVYCAPAKKEVTPDSWWGSRKMLSLKLLALVVHWEKAVISKLENVESLPWQVWDRRPIFIEAWKDEEIILFSQLARSRNLKFSLVYNIKLEADQFID